MTTEVNDLIVKYFEFNFDGDTDYEDCDNVELIEENYDEFVEAYFNAGERFDDYVDGYINLKQTQAQLIIDMINYVDEYFSDYIEDGINMWSKKKTIREVYRYYAYAYVMTEKDKFLNVFKECIICFEAEKKEDDDEVK